MTRAALYIRVSTEEQARHGLSLAEQENHLKEYARSKKMKIAGIYRDEGISARKRYTKRPALLQLLSDIEAGEIDTVLFIKLDRWFRSVADYYEVQRILDAHGVTWQTTEEDYETVTASGRFKVNIMLSVAQDEADRTSERIKFVFEGKRERREPLTGNCPTGYKIEGKKLVKDPEKESAVNAFFQRYLASGSVSEAQRAALEAGLRIEYQLASKMLASPVYHGHYYDVDGMAPPYITKADFDRIADSRHHPVRKAPTNRVYLFSGLIVCGECGSHMAGRVAAHNRTPSYNCPNHFIKRGGCENNVNLSERKIAAYIMDTIEGKFAAYKSDYAAAQAAKQEKNPQPEINAVKRKLSKLKDLYLNDLISLDEYKKDQARMTARLTELEAQKPVPPPDFSKMENIFKEDWKGLYADLGRAEQRDFWRLLVRRIYLFPDRHLEYDLAL